MSPSKSAMLVLKSSIMAESSQSSLLIDYALRERLPETITVRDLTNPSLPLLDGAGAHALRGAEKLTDRQRQLLALSDTLIAELQAASCLVIAAPMYNFHVPVQLKTWIDLVCRAGVTFNYTPQGPQGLLQGKKVVVISTRGGQHQEGDQDALTVYMKSVLGFIGIKDVQFVYAQGLNVSEQQQQHSLQQAKLALDALMLCV